MKHIVITTEGAYPNEARRIEEFLESGVELVHIRKPLWKLDQMENLIVEINEEYHNRLVIHSHFELSIKYDLHGIHHGKDRREIPDGHKGTISYSCHTINELLEKKSRYDYCTISPVFDSISKCGYKSNFSQEELQRAICDGIIDERVYALGGIDDYNIKILETMGFKGVCMLGAAWK